MSRCTDSRSEPEELRSRLLKDSSILSMAHLGTRAFDSIGGEVVSTTAFVLENEPQHKTDGYYIRLLDGRSETEKDIALRTAVAKPDCGWVYRASAPNLKKVPGNPIAYWLSSRVAGCFSDCDSLGAYADIKTGMQTGSNESFLRFWYETSSRDINAPADTPGAKRWYLYSKGGDFRKWSGNVEHIVDWEDDGRSIKSVTVNGTLRSRVRELSNYFRNAASWSFISSAKFGCRYKAPGIFFDVASSCALETFVPIAEVLGFLCSNTCSIFLNGLNPTLNFQIQDISNLPYRTVSSTADVVSKLVNISQRDWDSAETSWSFSILPILSSDDQASTLRDRYSTLRRQWSKSTLEMQRLEVLNNEHQICAFGLEGELKPDVLLEDITLNCNPLFRFGNQRSKDEGERLLLAESISEVVSYSVGCMFGRYALEKPGLILANQGDTMKEYLGQIPSPSFPADEDNVIPILDDAWFPDDIAERFKRFLRVTFGNEHLEENLKFVEDALGKKIRDYFSKDFYNDHLKRYKKRPIYWLFSSPKGSFNALIYMHRYRPDTVSVVMNGYLREFRAKLTASLDEQKRKEANPDTAKAEKTNALKEIERLRKVIDELTTWERDVIYPLASEQKEIDLDDGVKVNYAKFGTALKKIPGLDAGDE